MAHRIFVVGFMVLSTGLPIQVADPDILRIGFGGSIVQDSPVGRHNCLLRNSATSCMTSRVSKVW